MSPYFQRICIELLPMRIVKPSSTYKTDGKPILGSVRILVGPIIRHRYPNPRAGVVISWIGVDGHPWTRGISERDSPSHVQSINPTESSLPRQLIRDPCRSRRSSWYGRLQHVSMIIKSKRKCREVSDTSDPPRTKEFVVESYNFLSINAEWRRSPGDRPTRPRFPGVH